MPNDHDDVATETDKSRAEFQQKVRAGLASIGANGTAEQLVEFYNNNVDDYDKMLEFVKYQELGNCALVTALAELLPNKDARILDVAAGSGIVGRELRRQGYDNIDALEPAEKMLDKAKEKNLYRNYIVDYINADRKNSIQDHTYDVVCIGAAMQPGHITLDFLPELMRVTKKGGIIIFNVADKYSKIQEAFQKDKLSKRFQTFIDNKEWSRWDTLRSPYRDDEDCSIFRIILS